MARGGDGVAAPLPIDPTEGRAVRVAPVRVNAIGDRIARLEVVHHVRAGADRLQVPGEGLGVRPAPILEDVLRQDRVGERQIPGRVRGLKSHPGGVVVRGFDVFDRAVGTEGCRAGLFGGNILPGEDDIPGGEGLAVAPLHALLQLPGDAHSIGGETPVLARRDLGGKPRHEAIVLVEVRQRLQDEAGGVGVLPAGREVRIHRGRSLPVEDFQRPRRPASARPRTDAARRAKGRGRRCAKRAGRAARRRRGGAGRGRGDGGRAGGARRGGRTTARRARRRCGRGRTGRHGGRRCHRGRGHGRRGPTATGGEHGGDRAGRAAKRHRTPDERAPGQRPARHQRHQLARHRAIAARGTHR